MAVARFSCEALAKGGPARRSDIANGYPRAGTSNRNCSNVPDQMT